MRIRSRENPIASLVERVASIEASGVQLAGLFAATVILRNLLESLAAGSLFPAPAFIFHFPIAYVFPMMGLTGLLHVLSGYPLGKLLKLMVFAWTLTLLPPLLDFLLGTTSAIGYFPLQRSNWLFFLVNFFNPAVELPGTTAGIRIEAAIGCLLAGVFSWSVGRDRRLLRGTGTTLLFAPVFLVFFTWPSLVYIMTVDLFPFAETMQQYFQWHAAATPHLTGSLHYTVFIVDLIPVTILLAWFYRKLDPDGFGRVRAGLSGRIWTLSAAVGGSVCFLAASRGSVTFADTVSAAGALLSAVLLIISAAADRRAGWIMRSVALAAAAATGWPTVAMLILGISLAMLPGPAWISRCSTAAASFLVAFSPAGLAPGAWIVIPLLLCGLAGAALKKVSAAAGLASLVAAVLFAPGRTSSYTEYYTGLFDAVSRNGRLDLTLPVAREMAASGGDMLNLAKAELESGNANRARWCYEITPEGGELSPDGYRLGLNLALVQGRDEDFDALMAFVMSDEELRGSIDIGSIMLARAASRGDTSFVRRAIEIAGPSPQLYHAFSTACSASGDGERAWAYARAALSHPEAREGQYAWAIGLAAMTGSGYDSLFEAGMDRFPGSVEIMRARLLAPVSMGRAPDREDLLKRILVLQPASTAVLRTATLWYLGAGRFDEATAHAVRAIASTGDPDAALLLAACTAASSSGDSASAEATATYASALFPGDPAFYRFLELPARGTGH